MGKRESYEPGTFSWVDLSTPDAEGAKTFYGGLFGREFRDDEVPGGGVYTMCSREGDAAGAFYSTLFDWEIRPIEQDGTLVYATIKNEASQNGGFMR